MQLSPQALKSPQGFTNAWAGKVRGILILNADSKLGLENCRFKTKIEFQHGMLEKRQNNPCELSMMDQGYIVRDANNSQVPLQN